MSDRHFYGKGGEPRYEADLRIARKEHLLPSVTTYLQIINKVGLNIWKETKIYNKCYHDSPVPGDSLSEWKARLKKELKIEMGKSAELGQKIHSAIEKTIKRQDAMWTEEFQDTCMAVLNLIHNHNIKVVEAERSFANYDLGFGGKIDLVCEVDGGAAVLDWKTKDTKGKEINKIRLYNDVPMQLSACANGIWKPTAKLYTVIVSRDEPGVVSEPILWEDNEKYWKGFQSAQILWCMDNNYNPWTGGKWF